jgi:hypothetical protein
MNSIDGRTRFFLKKIYTFLQPYQGTRQLDNALWSILITTAGIGFFLSGLSSFFHVNFLSLNKSTITFLPQGIIMMFYGIAGILLGLFLGLIVFWNIGNGYNKYCKDSKRIILYRRKFPGLVLKNALIISIPFSQLKSIKIKIKRRDKLGGSLFVCLLDKRQIPLIYEDEIEKCQRIANLLSNLAKVSIEF